MNPTLATDVADVVKWPFFGSLAIIAVGLLITLIGVMAMLRAPASAPATRGGEATAAIGPWDIVKEIVGALVKWGSKALRLFMDKSRPTGEKIVGLGLFVTFIGVLLAVVTAVIWAAASVIDAGDDGVGSTTPTSTTS